MIGNDGKKCPICKIHLLDKDNKCTGCSQEFGLCTCRNDELIVPEDRNGPDGL